MRKILLIALLPLITAILVGCATAPTSALTSLQKRVIEAKDLDGSFDDVFKATVTILQDKGFDIKTSDYQGGIISAAQVTKSAFLRSKNILWCASGGILGKPEGNSAYRIIINIEKFTDKITKIRVSIYKDVFDGFGNRWDCYSGQVEDPATYQGLYAEIQKEMFRRAQLNR